MRWRRDRSFPHKPQKDRRAGHDSNAVTRPGNSAGHTADYSSTGDNNTGKERAAAEKEKDRDPVGLIAVSDKLQFVVRSVPQVVLTVSRDKLKFVGHQSIIIEFLLSCSRT